MQLLMASLATALTTAGNRSFSGFWLRDQSSTSLPFLIARCLPLAQLIGRRGVEQCGAVAQRDKQSSVDGGGAKRRLSLPASGRFMADTSRNGGLGETGSE